MTGGPYPVCENEMRSANCTTCVVFLSNYYGAVEAAVLQEGAGVSREGNVKPLISGR